jgi:serine/threonine-protein kinase RsbW
VNRSDERARSIRSFPAEAESLADIRQYVRSLAQIARLPERTTEDLVLAVSEACANAVIHSGSSSMEIQWRLRPDRVEIEVRDQGLFRNRVRVPSVDGPGGFGIPLMAALTEELVIEEGTRRRPGTSVRLTKRTEES